MHHTDKEHCPQHMDAAHRQDFRHMIRQMPWVYEPILQVIGQQLEGASRLHDVACGDGYLLSLIHDRFPQLELSGSDIDARFIAHAQQDFPFASFRCAAAQDLEGDYDLVTSNLAFHHFPEPQRLVKHLLSCAKKLIISDHLRPDTEEELLQRVQAKEAFFAEKDLEKTEAQGREMVMKAYSRSEWETFWRGFDAELLYFDEDYYERSVVILEG